MESTWVVSDGSPYCYAGRRETVEPGLGRLVVVAGTVCDFLVHGTIVRPVATCTVRVTNDESTVEELTGDDGPRYLLLSIIRHIEPVVVDEPVPTAWLESLPFFPVEMHHRTPRGISLYLPNSNSWTLETAQKAVMMHRKQRFCSRDDFFALFVHIRRLVYEQLLSQNALVKCCEHHKYDADEDHVGMRINIEGGVLEASIKRKGRQIYVNGDLFSRAFLRYSHGAFDANTLASVLSDVIYTGEWRTLEDAIKVKRAFCAIATAARLCRMLPPLQYPLLDRIASCSISAADVADDDVLGEIISRTGDLRVECELERGVYIFGRGGTDEFVLLRSICAILRSCHGEEAWRTWGCLATDVDCALEQTVGVVGRSAVAFLASTGRHTVAGVLLVTRDTALYVTRVRILLRNSYDERPEMGALAERVRRSRQVHPDTKVTVEWVWKSERHAQTQHREGSCTQHAAMLALKLAREIGTRPTQKQTKIIARIQARCEPKYAAVCEHAWATGISLDAEPTSRVRNSIICTSVFSATASGITLCATIQCDGRVMLSAWTASETTRLSTRGSNKLLTAETMGSDGLSARWPTSGPSSWRRYEARGLFAALNYAMVRCSTRRGTPITVRMYRGRVWPTDDEQFAFIIKQALNDAGFVESRSLPYMSRVYEADEADSHV